MKLKLMSIFVDDQNKALKIYTEKLGFIKKQEIPLGEFKWLTVVSPLDPDGTELLLEPNIHAAALAYQKAIYGEGIPATTLFVENTQNEYERLISLGVKFTTEPTYVGKATIAIFDDTCGNLILIAQEN